MADDLDIGAELESSQNVSVRRTTPLAARPSHPGLTGAQQGYEPGKAPVAHR
jgi:hypothetical protein